MRMDFLGTVVVFILVPTLEWVGGSVVSRRFGSDGASGLSCEFFNKTCLSVEENKDVCAGERRCPSASHNCFAVWDEVENSEGANHRSGHVVELMGCLDETSRCEVNCTASNMKRGKLFCCCKGNLCNVKFYHNLTPETPTSTTETPEDPPRVRPRSTTGLFNFIYAIITVIIVSVVLAVCFYVYRQRKNAHFNPVPPDEDQLGAGGDAVAAETQPLEHIELVEIKARGRFGAVWKGHQGQGSDAKVVAVKIFPLQDKNSWQAEQEIYNLPRMDHENILKFLGVEKRGENLQTEFWLTSEFHENGSLCDFLKSNVVSWEDLCKIALSMAKGLTHLHEEIPKSGTKDMKPAIAHRDFKSKNVLIKSDMTACIADFGLALIFEPGKSCGDTHGQVGTRRYMAPEVLEGAINFSRDAFLRIDMYACGLVLWELASRCTIVRGSPVNVSTAPVVNNNFNLSTHCTNSVNTAAEDEYKLPFEAEASNPSLEKMQELVVNHKTRPRIKPEWRNCPGMSALCDTIEECWDQDAEARLSASCVMERVRSFQRLNQSVITAQNNRLGSEENRMNVLNDQHTAVASLSSPTHSPEGMSSEMTPLLIMNRNVPESSSASNTLEAASMPGTTETSS